MFVLSRDVSAAKRVIATLLATALVLWVIGPIDIARADDLSNISDTLTDSAPGASSDHTIAFTHPAASTGVGNGQTIVLDFSDGPFDLTGIGTEDVSLFVDGADFGQGNWGLANGGTTLTLTITTGSIAAGSSTVIYIGNNASNDGDAPDSQIVNPALSPDPNVTNTINGNESFEISVSAGTNDSGRTRVVILNTVLVTAAVDTVFNFVVTGVNNGVAVNGTTTNATSSSTTIPFGTLTAYAPVTLAQDLSVESNAINGFVVTLQSDGPLESTNGADIDAFEDGSDTNTPTAWSSPLTGLDISNENTWGHWGITTEDQDTDGMRDGDEFAANEFIGVSTTPRQVFAHDGPADAQTTSIGTTTVGFQVEISPLQEAGDDYQTTLTYIATPTF